MKKIEKILLVEPDFPYPNKSKNKGGEIHKNFVPIGLLKLGAMHKAKGDKVQLVRGLREKSDLEFTPNKILITSLFTYWSKYVWISVEYYRSLFPKAIISIGGVYATLHADTKKVQDLAIKYNVHVHKGVCEDAEKFYPDYSLLPTIEYHATHMMRGCIRHCSFCGTWKIEPKLMHKTTDEIIKELQTVGKNKIVFFDNNLLANPNIKEILIAFQSLRVNGRPVLFESQSGFDGRLLEKDPELAVLLKMARFNNIRIAWDNALSDKESIKRQIDILRKSGYAIKDICIFMIYNFILSPEIMKEKLNYCKKWGVQITDCRFRPLNLDYDNYNSHSKAKQTQEEYYMHLKSGWTDETIKEFRSKVREHNIWIRYAKDKGLKYEKRMEKWSSINNLYKYFKLGKAPQMDLIENNSKISRRIELLRKLKHYHQTFNMTPPDLSKIPLTKLDLILKRMFDIKSEKFNEKDKFTNVIQAHFDYAKGFGN